MTSLEAQVSPRKVSAWLSQISSVSKYQVKDSNLTITSHCTECGRVFSSSESGRTMCITGINSGGFEERVFSDICSGCYSKLKPLINDKMK